ncbi:hypothetical protein OAI84_00235 [bacterium]|nr:hypothetical protein [bacterium]
MRFKDIILSFIIILLFLIIVGWNIFSTRLSNIKTNWTKYRCDPVVMPFAEFFGHNSTENFNYCIQDVQKKNMGKYLEPVNYAVNMANHTTKQNTDSVQSMRQFLFYLRNQLERTIRRIFTVFLGTIMPIQQILVRFKDLTMKMLASMAVMLYIVDGSNKTMISAWNSDAGGVLRTLCFHPETLITMSDGSLEFIKDIKINDRLKNNIVVTGTLVLQGNDKHNPFYRIFSRAQNSYIFVTGSHLIKDYRKNKFVPVSEVDYAVKTQKTSSYMCCLITSNHLIPVGEHLFWDWEDENVLT